MQRQSDLLDIATTLSWLEDMGLTDIADDHPVNRLKAAILQPILDSDVGHHSLEVPDNKPDNKNTRQSRGSPQKALFSGGDAVQHHIPQMVAKARLLAQEAETLTDLEDALSVFTGCSLKETATHTVFSDGVSEAKVMLVGEAPGADEDRYGKPFIGRSGKLLDQMLWHIGLDRQANLYISNIIPWRPPGNRAPTIAEIDVCRPFIERHIQLIQPDLLILSGAIAAKTLLNRKQGITQLRGKLYQYDLSSFSWEKKSDQGRLIAAYAIFHPAFILRQPLQKKVIWRDLLQIRDQLDKINLSP